MLASAYKKLKDKKESTLLPTTDPRLSSESVTVPLNDSSANPLHDGIRRQPSVVDVENKAAKRKQMKMLAISMFLDILLPVILYVRIKFILDSPARFCTPSGAERKIMVLP